MTDSVAQKPSNKDLREKKSMPKPFAQYYLSI